MKFSLIITTIAILLPFQPTLADHNGVVVYATPGLQLSYNTSSGFSYSGQLTLGIIPDEHSSIPFPGITFGFRQGIKSPLAYTYIDFQLATPVGGVGIGKVFNDNTSNFRMKVFGGFLLHLCYDRMLKDNIWQPGDFGIIGVVPILVSPSYNDYVL